MRHIPTVHVKYWDIYTIVQKIQDSRQEQTEFSLELDQNTNSHCELKTTFDSCEMEAL